MKQKSEYYEKKFLKILLSENVYRIVNLPRKVVKKNLFYSCIREFELGGEILRDECDNYKQRNLK